MVFINRLRFIFLIFIFNFLTSCFNPYLTQSIAEGSYKLGIILSDVASKKSTEKLLDAIEKNNFEEVKFLVSIGLNINTGIYTYKSNYQEYTSPLFLATKKGNIEIIKFLLSKKAKIEFTNPDSINNPHVLSLEPFYSCLAQSIKDKREDIAKIFILNNANLNFKLRNEENILILSIKNGLVDISKLIIEKGADVGSINTLNSVIESQNKDIISLVMEKIDIFTTEYNPLFTAIKTGNKDIINLLIEKNNSIKASLKDDKILFQAAVQDKLEISKLLVEKGAKLNFYTMIYLNYENEINKIIDDKYTTIIEITRILTASIELKKINLVKKILKKNINLNFTDSFKSGEKNSYLNLAIDTNDENIVKLLLEKGVNVNLYSYPIEPSIIYAIHKGNKKIVELLLNNNVNINVKDKNGKTLFIIAEESENKEIIDLFKYYNKSIISK